MSKFKNLAVKVALVGISGIILGSGLMSANIMSEIQALPSMKAVQERVYTKAEIEKNMGLSDIQMEVMMEQGIINGDNMVNIRELYDAKTGMSARNTAQAMVDELCEVNLAYDLNTGFSSSARDSKLKDVAAPIVKYSESEMPMINQYMAAHEYAHCSFVGLKDKLQVNGNSQASAILNKVYGDTMLVRMATPESELEYGLAGLLNEAYADSMAFVSLVKESKGSPEVLTFMKKISAERLISTNLGNRVAADKIDGYDISLATKLLNNPDMVKQIIDANSPEQLHSIAIGNANRVVIHSLAKKSEADLEIAIGAGMVKIQAETGTGVYTGAFQGNSIVANSVAKGLDSLTKEEMGNFRDYLDILNNPHYQTQEKIDVAAANYKVLNTKVKEALPKVDQSEVELGMNVIKAEIAKIKDSSTVQHKDFDSTIKEIEDSGLSISTKDIATARAAFKEVQQSRIEAANKVKPS